jgi:fructokinase|tara:strand:+ start:369 stop:1250 length:882 start_codon:yes stop_codon:yes gene_type:complete
VTNLTITNKVVVGIGELLWDVFPSVKHIGGSPANFIYHINQLGASGIIVSSIGKDSQGNEIYDNLKRVGISGEYIQRNNHLPTGISRVQIDNDSTPSYKIDENVAWDNIVQSDAINKLANECNAVYFGTLAQRSKVSRDTINKFLQNTKPDTLKICDINFRKPFYNQEIVFKSLEICNILKLNIDELQILCDILIINESEDKTLEILTENYNLDLIALTKGEGSRIFSKDCDSHMPPRIIEIEDTVGAGDSFTAGMVIGLLKGLSLIEVHKLADQIATFVCTMPGATPELNFN